MVTDVAHRKFWPSSCVCSPMGPGSLRAAVLTLTFSGVGCGLLGLPWSFATLGWAGGSIAMVVCACLAATSLHMLAEVREATQSSSYARAVELSFGTRCGETLALLIVVANIGAASAAVHFATDFESSLMQALGPAAGPQRTVVTAGCRVALLGVLCVLTWAKGITRWRYLSVISVLVLLYVIFVIVGEAVFGASSEGSSSACLRLEADSLEAFRWPGLGGACQAIAVICFSSSCHFNLLPVLEVMEHANSARISAVCFCSICLMFVFYSAVSIAGYAIWRQALLRGSMQGDVLGCWGNDDRAVMGARAALIGVLALHAALLLHAARDNLLRSILPALRSCWSSMLRRRSAPNDGDAETARVIGPWGFHASTAGLLALVLLLSNASVIRILGFAGGIGSITTMFVFPAAMFVREARSTVALRHVIAIGGFAVVSVAGLVSALHSLAPSA
mmetsp:Transcript_47498/g.151530  ORF Transcript_47498/g.151530 Transcript_47498/m.151530 type:complete len:449 (-) Transcript_47498:2-1348(-)